VAAYAAERIDAVVETGLSFRPGDPVRIHVVHRPHRTSVSDDGAAIKRAGRPRGWVHAARRIEEESIVNVSRSGVVSLPVVRVGPPEEEIIRRIAAASLAFYHELLDLGG
jgi:hypothetical protein